MRQILSKHSVTVLSALDSHPTMPQALQPGGPGLPATILLFHILYDGTLGKCQLILSLGLVIKERFHCTL